MASDRAPATVLARAARPGVPRLAVAPAAAPAGSAAAPSATPPPAAAPALAGAAPARNEPPVDKAEALRKAIEPGDSPARGNPKAPITIVSYSEFQCPFCARVVPTLRELEKAYPDQIRLVWKHLPLAFHESAPLAAEAALAAGEQGKFWEMHDRLFAAQDRLDLPALEEHARALALDVPSFRAALDGAKFKRAGRRRPEAGQGRRDQRHPHLLHQRRAPDRGAAADRVRAPGGDRRWRS